MKKRLVKSKYIIDARGDEITKVDRWIEINLDKNEFEYELMDIFPKPWFRYYFKCPQQHLLALLSTWQNNQILL